LGYWAANYSVIFGEGVRNDSGAWLLRKVSATWGLRDSGDSRISDGTTEGVLEAKRPGAMFGIDNLLEAVSVVLLVFGSHRVATGDGGCKAVKKISYRKDKPLSTVFCNV
jgi:hypothetical protein